MPRGERHSRQHEWHAGVVESGGLASRLLLEVLEPVRQRRAAITLVRELRNEQRERLDVAGDVQGPSVYRIEAHVANELRGSRACSARRAVCDLPSSNLCDLRWIRVVRHEDEDAPGGV
jgi:hypothetical protein